MLCQFSFKNFKLYKNETTFDFQAEALSEFQETLIISEKGSSLLPISVVYGPNGGGKTNLLKALSCLIALVVKPIRELGTNREKIVLQQNVMCESFIFDKTSVDEPTEFNIYFRTNGNEYRYYIALNEDKILSESLYRRTVGGKKTAVLFEREENTIEVGPSISKNNTSISSVNTGVNPKMPYFSFLAINYSFPHVAEAQRWFESCIIRNYANPKVETSVLLSKDIEFKRKFIDAMNDMGIDITDYQFDKENNQVMLQRKINDNAYYISFNDESDGTKKLFSALPILMIALTQGRLIIIDELDAKLHPKLLRYIIGLFTNPKVNNKGAQLLFTSHDLSTMKNDVFRRDEIWFAALDDEHSSELYSLYDIRKEDGKRINHTASYDKQYLEGRYGAAPMVF